MPTGAAILIADTSVRRSLATSPMPLPPGIAVVVLDTATRRGLVDSAYNERRAQCEAAARALGVVALRDGTLAMLDAVDLPDVVARRARHVITENERVLETVTALRVGDLQQVGALMDASHISLRDLYEVSSVELDAMVELLRRQPGCYGARLTGAGFGGCAVALLEAGAVDAAIPLVAAAYRSRTGLTPALYPTRAAAGASAITL
jgi:galactokinase